MSIFDIGRAEMEAADVAANLTALELRYLAGIVTGRITAHNGLQGGCQDRLVRRGLVELWEPTRGWAGCQLTTPTTFGRQVYKLATDPSLRRLDRTVNAGVK